MKVTICFVPNNAPPLQLTGDTLGTYEIGSFTHIKDYSRARPEIIALVPTDKILFIQYFNTSNIEVTVEDVKKEAGDYIKHSQ